MTSLSRWHFLAGGGESYCAGCCDAGAECATSRRTLCNYHQFRPRTDSGRLAWEMFKASAWRVRYAGLGVPVGIDLDAARRQIVAGGAEEWEATRLLDACEIGFLKALSENRENDGED